MMSFSKSLRRCVFSLVFHSFKSSNFQYSLIRCSRSQEIIFVNPTIEAFGGIGPSWLNRLMSSANLSCDSFSNILRCSSKAALQTSTCNIQPTQRMHPIIMSQKSVVTSHRVVKKLWPWYFRGFPFHAYQGRRKTRRASDEC